MIKEILVSVCIGALAAAGVYTKKGIDATYLKIEELEHIADSIYVRQDVYRQTENQKRTWQLEDRIDEIKARARGRDLTPEEKERIKQIQRDIKLIR